MKFASVLFISLCTICGSKLDKANFYEVFESESKTKIEKKISSLSKLDDSTIKTAYIGALTMKKSAYEKSLKEKTMVFSKGKDMLEKAINKESRNAEFRFLRLAIQEHCPKILKYNSDISEDVALINQTYSSLGSVLQKVIHDYSKESEYLSADQLN